MKIVELLRREESNFGSIGILSVDKKILCFTLEPPNKQNYVNESCIPTGQYLCKKINSPKFGETFEVIGVTGRSHILFHTGNTSEQTQGCILLGEAIGELSDRRAVLKSKTAFKKFKDIMSKENEFHLTISEKF